MTTDRAGKSQNAKADAEVRLAEALRANLRRRKDQARARQTEAPEAGTASEDKRPEKE